MGRGTQPGWPAHRTDDRFVGVELFQIDSFDAERCKNYPSDPIQITLGLLSGQLAAETPAGVGAGRSAVDPGGSLKAAAVAPL